MGARPSPLRFFPGPWFSPGVYVKNQSMCRVLSIRCRLGDIFSPSAKSLLLFFFFFSSHIFSCKKRKKKLPLSKAAKRHFFLGQILLCCVLFFIISNDAFWGSCSILELSGPPSGAKLGFPFWSETAFSQRMFFNGVRVQ